MADHASRVAMPIRHHGPFLDVVVAPTRGALAGLKVRGLIDTGADGVLVSHSIQRSLNLRHVGNEMLNGIGGQQAEGKLCSARIQVSELSFDRVLPVYAVDWDETSHAVLLGRTFLKHFVFLYDGPSEVFQFSNPID